MALSTYSDLQTAISAWNNNSSVASVVTDIIDLAEAWIRPNAQVLWLEKRAYAETVSAQEDLALPTDFNGMRSVHISASPNIQLEQVSLPYLRESMAGRSGKPVYYAVADGSIFFGPVPDSAYEIRMDYYEFPALSDSQTTNEILTRYPDVYLFSCLAEAADYMKDEDEIARYSVKKQVALENMKSHDRTLRYGGVLATKVG